MTRRADDPGQGTRRFLVGVLVAVLLIWGPLDESWAYPRIIRLSYLVLIPMLAHRALTYGWRAWRPDAAEEDRLQPTLAGAVAERVSSERSPQANSSTHVVCTQELRTHEGYECVGDLVQVPGPDYGGAFVLLLGTYFAVRMSMAAPD